MLMRLQAASRVEGAPKQPALHRLTKKTPPPPFLRSTPEGWRVETDDPSWGDLIARASVRSLPQKLRAGFPRKKGGGGADDGYTPSGAAEAAVEKLVQQARNERIKAESALIDLEAKRGAYVERERMEWLLSFIQRGIADGLAQIRKKLKDDEKIAAFCAEMEEVMMRMAAMLEKEGADGE